MLRKNPTCYLDVPDSQQFDVIRSLTHKVLEELNVENVNTEQLRKMPATEVLKRTDMVVADLTGQNPNVLFELGMAHALRIPILALSQEGPDALHDLAGLRVVLYRPEDTEKLEGYLKYWVSDIAREAADLLAS